MQLVIAVVEHHSVYGCWTLWQRLPAPGLRDWLVAYCGYREARGRPVERRQLPSPVVPLILDLGEPWQAAEKVATDHRKRCGEDDPPRPPPFLRVGTRSERAAWSTGVKGAGYA